MFKLSKGAEYAIRGILHISMQPPGAVCFVEEISRVQDVPRAYLAKIFQTLAKKGLLISTRGQGGGFRLLRSASELTVLEVIEAVEGPVHLNECLLHKGFCKRDAVCPVHDVWHEAQKTLLGLLSGCSFEDLSRSGLEKLRPARGAGGGKDAGLDAG